MADAAQPQRKKNQAFLISQVNRESSDIRKRANIIHELIVTPIAKEFGLRVLRSDRDPTPGPVTSQILRSILESRVVVADLTGRNPNVYYELAFSHSFGLPVVILVDKTESLTFDVKNERVIEIGDEGHIDMEQGDNTKKELHKTLEVVLAPEYVPRSLVTEVAEVQELQRLSPENPMATELSNIRQRVDQIYSEFAGRENRLDLRHDMRVMTGFIGKLARNGRFERDEIEDLINDSTSTGFDDWVRRTVDAIPTSDEEEDFEDIPF